MTWVLSRGSGPAGLWRRPATDHLLADAHLAEALEHAYQAVRLDDAVGRDEVFRQLVLARNGKEPSDRWPQPSEARRLPPEESRVTGTISILPKPGPPPT